MLKNIIKTKNYGNLVGRGDNNKMEIYFRSRIGNFDAKARYTDKKAIVLKDSKNSKG